MNHMKGAAVIKPHPLGISAVFQWLYYMILDIQVYKDKDIYILKEEKRGILYYSVPAITTNPPTILGTRQVCDVNKTIIVVGPFHHMAPMSAARFGEPHR